MGPVEDDVFPLPVALVVSPPANVEPAVPPPQLAAKPTTATDINRAARSWLRIIELREEAIASRPQDR